MVSGLELVQVSRLHRKVLGRTRPRVEAEVLQAHQPSGPSRRYREAFRSVGRRNQDLHNLLALSGSNFIYDAIGLVEFALTASFKQYVIDDAIIGMTMRAVRGIEVSDETIALDAHRRTCPGGNFLTDVHTRCPFGRRAWMDTYPNSPGVMREYF